MCDVDYAHICRFLEKQLVKIVRETVGLNREVANPISTGIVGLMGTCWAC
ncbi:hypothetical protein KEJ18_03650 [Candidatus Bathyarchaeota archaeon]|nr:hypothetical protein [Candidatus Bathyarchaeota archaeon]